MGTPMIGRIYHAAPSGDTPPHRPTYRSSTRSSRRGPARPRIWTTTSSCIWRSSRGECIPTPAKVSLAWILMFSSHGWIILPGCASTLRHASCHRCRACSRDRVAQSVTAPYLSSCDRGFDPYQCGAPAVWPETSVSNWSVSLNAAGGPFSLCMLYVYNPERREKREYGWVRVPLCIARRNTGIKWRSGTKVPLRQ
jgi:hypothetical protein